jgi:LmbE family N-acetylglucosaminyl deacetylase
VKILAVGAHPDDIELGCGATLALFKKKGHEVHFLVLTSGEASGNPSRREQECRQSAKAIGADKVHFGKLPDTKITDGVETIMTIERVIQKLRPDIVFAHSPKDSHQDHRNAGLASISAARNSKKVLLYESPAALRDFVPQCYVDVTATFEIKLKALEAFGSQVSKIYFKGNNASQDHLFVRSPAAGVARIPYVSNAAEGLARFRGFQAGVDLAEGFEVGKFLMEITDNNER